MQDWWEKYCPWRNITENIPVIGWVNCKGRIAPCFAGRKVRLEAENIVMKDERHVNLRRFQWDM